MGDIIHTFPAITDAVKQCDSIQFDWVVEEAFSGIVRWHPAVDKVIPIAIRRWRKNIFSALFNKDSEFNQLKQFLKKQKYDVIIDAQGLLKSAFLIPWASKGYGTDSYGLDKHSVREALASRFYKYPQRIDKNQHAVERIRQLFAKSLSYKIPEKLDYGIERYFSTNKILHKPKQIIFIHATTWQSKHWPDIYWIELAQLLVNDGFQVLLPWSNTVEKNRVEDIKAKVKYQESKLGIVDLPYALPKVLPKMTLDKLGQMIFSSDASVAVDTGLAHLAAALSKPQICLFGSTKPDLTRPYGENQQFLQVSKSCKACMQKNCSKEAKVLNTIIKPSCYVDLKPKIILHNLYKMMGLI